MFTIQMTDINSTDEEVVVEGTELNIDPGASARGMAVVSEVDGTRRAHALIELRHRGNRGRNRRGRLRNRPPRFDNRTRPEGWLPPSLISRLANTMTWVERLETLYPVRHIRVETTVFDTQLMEDAEISGEQYQQGNLLGWQLRSYVFHRDGRRCAYCGNARTERYELDHIMPRSRGGSDRVSNLVVSCHDCNAAKGNASVEEFLADSPERLASVRRLRALEIPVSTHDAYTTSWTRQRLGVPKTHVNDALCLGRPESVVVPEVKLAAQATGHGDRQMLKPPDRHGNPRGRGYRDYCALSRERQGYTRCPGHRSHTRRIASMASGDLVRFRHSKRGTLMGYAGLDKRAGRVGVMHRNRIVSVKAEAAILVARDTGYRVSAAENAA